MASKKTVLFTVLLFLAALASIAAQDSDSFLEVRYVQRLKWIADEYALRYEVVIQREDRGGHTTILNEFTEASFIEVSLHPGKYRVQVIPYDYFGKPVPVTEWMNFEVLPGKAPEEEKASERVTEIDYVTESEGEPEVEVETIILKQFDFFAGIAYVPILPIYGKNQLFGKNISPLGFSARFSAVTAKASFMNFGAELTASWNVYGLGTEQKLHSPSFDLNVLAQNRFPGGNMALNLRAGVGLSLLPKTYTSTPNGQYSFHLNVGASFLWLFVKNFYLEIGANHSHFFAKDYFGAFSPWIGIGYRF